MKLFKDILTGIDNHTFDNGRVVTLSTFLVYYIMAISSLFTCHPWNPVDFSTGAAAMAVGFGFNLRLKQSTEPGSLPKLG